MARIKEEGVYRCRLQLDNGHPCIDVIEHYARDKENKCVDESKPLGGLQVILRADAWKMLDNGELSNTYEELDLSTFGVTIVSPTEYGEEVRKDIVANFVRIFELRDASELLEIASVNPKQLTDAVLIAVHTRTSAVNCPFGLHLWVKQKQSRKPLLLQPRTRQ